ncbi:hypothetical protein BDZ89DRAFT_1134859 [Hymenopellis radicata]|nr:hypothetical protein BDZ89DRAFT_1134859 [Hymenopellis radicata]
MESFPDLPLDVVRLLLEEAAWSDRFTTAHNLTLVSKDVRQWIEPILYHTVTLDTSTKLYAFAATVTSRNNRDFFRRTVKVLIIGDLEIGHFSGDIILVGDSVSVVLAACADIKCFAFWVDAPAPIALPVTIHPHPTHLSLIGGNETSTLSLHPLCHRHS